MGPDKGVLAAAMAKTIADEVDDPAGWLVEARRIAEIMELDVTRIRFHGLALREVCFDIVDHADKRMNMDAEQVRAALRRYRDERASGETRRG